MQTSHEPEHCCQTAGGRQAIATAATASATERKRCRGRMEIRRTRFHHLQAADLPYRHAMLCYRCSVEPHLRPGAAVGQHARRPLLILILRSLAIRPHQLHTAPQPAGQKHRAPVAVDLAQAQPGGAGGQVMRRAGERQPTGRKAAAAELDLADCGACHKLRSLPGHGPTRPVHPAARRRALERRRAPAGPLTSAAGPIWMPRAPAALPEARPSQVSSPQRWAQARASCRPAPCVTCVPRVDASCRHG